MAFTLNKNDRELLASIAEHRVLTVSQVASLLQRSARSARRRLSALSSAGLVHQAERAFNTGPGRPEGLISLTGSGIAILRESGVIRPEVEDARVAGKGFQPLDHQLLVNWFRIHLMRVEQELPHVVVRFLSPDSPFLERGPKDEPLVSDQVHPAGQSDKTIRFIPDGVFSITDTRRSQTVLFFLEADRGTESRASATGRQGNIRGKIETYQAYSRSGAYKRYEQLWTCALNGFRLLFLTETAGRLALLCRSVQALPPSDFVWLTDRDRMFESGLAAEIWARGGRNDKPLQSILGTLARPRPVHTNS
jgi:hypothetical protein